MRRHGRGWAALLLALGAGWGGAGRAGAQTVAAVSISGQSYATLADAIAAAAPGDSIVIGLGSLTLAAPLDIPSGVSVEGASPGGTHLDATGLDAGVRISGTGAADGTIATHVRGLEIAGAVRGIDVIGARGVIVRNVVLRDNQESGLHVSENADATLINGTLIRNGAGVLSSGKAQVRNTIITAGGTGLSAVGLGALISAYNDTTANTAAAYDHVSRGTGDMVYTVAFTAFDQNDFHLTDAQTVTDRGNSSDDFSAEPTPNGGRVNLGAFGGTAEAELSPSPPLKTDGGCAVAGSAPFGPAVTAPVVIALLALRRRPGRRRAGSDSDAQLPEQAV